MLGESREGGGEAAQQPTSDFIAAVVAALETLDYEVGELLLQRITTGTYHVAVQAHGEPEAYVYTAEPDGEGFTVQNHTPYGGYTGESEEQ